MIFDYYIKDASYPTICGPNDKLSIQDFVQKTNSNVTCLTID